MNALHFGLYFVFLYITDGPPSYEQLFGVGQMRRQVQEAKADSSNRGVFAAKVCEIFCGSGNHSMYLLLVMKALKCETLGAELAYAHTLYSQLTPFYV